MQASDDKSGVLLAVTIAPQDANQQTRNRRNAFPMCAVSDIMNRFAKIAKGFSISRETRRFARRAGVISPKPVRGAHFSILNSEEVASSGKQRESAAESGCGDSIRRNHKRPADSRPFMYGIKHNKIIDTKTLSRCLKSCAHIDFICLDRELKLN
jgi:hypothetical protein